MISWQQVLANPKLINTGLLINGNWIYDKEQSKVENPADGRTIATVAIATLADIEAAIESAQIAFLSWKTVSAKERSKILRKWYELILNNVDDLAKIVTLECGKPFQEAQGEVIYAANFVEWYSEEAKRMDGEIIAANNPKQRALILKQPIGVCAAITPWNFPSAMLTRKVAPALASGCAIIARPSSQTPLSALALAYLALEAGLPAGLLNVITGDSDLISNAFCNSPKVRKLSFTGSTEVGIKLYQNSASTMKRLSLELGGNAPFIVFEDANLNSAIEGLLKTKFRNAGQTCVCANRIFVAESVYEEFIAHLLPKVEQLKVGNGLDADIDIGPLINAKAIEHAKSLIEDALMQGAKLVCGGTMHKLGGNFFTPTLITNCNPSMRIFNEEIFAPIIAVYKFKHDDEVITLANQTPYGLGSYFYAKDTNKVIKIAENLEYGMVGINTGVFSGENVPFGGIKYSGFGREGGHDGINEYIEKKYICLDLN